MAGTLYAAATPTRSRADGTPRARRTKRAVSLPAASAVMAALSASGLPTAEFTFLGFAPARSKDRKQWLAGIVGESRTVVFFEAPHRIHSTLTELGHLIDDRPIGIGRELTKTHE